MTRNLCVHVGRGRSDLRRARRADRVGRRHVIAVAAILALCTSALPSAAAAQLPPERIRSLVESETEDAFATFREYLSLPNDGHFPDDIERLVVWLEDAFQARGFATERLSTPDSPLLLAERHLDDSAPTVLVYLQSDGQPVDPGAWFQESPYGPELKAAADTGWSAIPWERLDGEWNGDWRIFARSASDSKGPNIQFLKAIDAMEAAGVRPDYNLKVIVDTMEEMGSPHLPAAVERFRDRLAADMLIIFDGPPHYSGEPSLKFGARGIASFTLTTYGPRVAQHSGHYGNYAPNPGIRLAQLLASMKDEHGRVTLPGFYDGVELDAETRAILAAVPDDEEDVKRRLGIATIDSVAGSLQEAVQYPSLNVRGLRSAWVGDETRTIVPPTAVAEVDVRLVRESDPQRLLGLVRTHIEGQGYHVIEGRDPTEEERLTHPRIARFDTRVSYRAFRTDFDSPPGRWLREGFRNLFGEEPILIRTSGGSIPISPFVSTLGIPAVTVPTVNPDNNQHSPNENIRVGSFVEGIGIVLSVLSQPLKPFMIVG